VSVTALIWSVAGWCPGHPIPATRLPLHPLAKGEAATFLGAKVRFNVILPLATLAEIIAIGLRNARSKLVPWQRKDLGAEDVFQRLGKFLKMDWTRVEKILRPEIKVTLYLP